MSKRSRAAGQSLRLWLCRAVAGVSAAGMVALGGCKKSAAPPPGAIQVGGVRMDLPKLVKESQTASPEIQAAVKQIDMAYRHGRFGTMQTELEALSNNPDLSAPHKKLVGDLIEEVKQVIAKMPGPPR